MIRHPAGQLKGHDQGSWRDEEAPAGGGRSRVDQKRVQKPNYSNKLELKFQMDFESKEFTKKNF